MCCIENSHSHPIIVLASLNDMDKDALRLDKDQTSDTFQPLTHFSAADGHSTLNTLTGCEQ
jgi:hypothetical protein